MNPRKITSILGLSLMMMVASGAAPDAAAKEKAVAKELKYSAAEHLLDGTSFEYFYQTGGGLKIAFADGKLQ